MESQATARDDLIGGLAVGGVLNPCIDACNRTLILCIVAEGISHLIGIVRCTLISNPFCYIENIIVSIIVTVNCFPEHAACVAAC